MSVPEVGTFTREARRRTSILTSQQHPRPLRRAQAPLPAPVPGLPHRRARAGDRPLQGHRAARGAGRAAGRDRARAARAGAAQGAVASPRPSTGRARWPCSASSELDGDGARSDTAAVVVKYDARRRAGPSRRCPGSSTRTPRSRTRGRPRARPRTRARARRATTTRRPDADDGRDGKAVRAAKDEPGPARRTYYGAPGGRSTSGAAVAQAGRAGRSGQGQRSFARRRARRKRPVVRRPGLMEDALHRFVRLLRLRGCGSAISEALDAMHARRAAGRARRPRAAALGAARRRWSRTAATWRSFDGSSTGSSGWGGRRPRRSTATATPTTTSPTTASSSSSRCPRTPATTPQQGHSHGKPGDIKEYFNPEDMAQQYNLHQEANKIDMAALTDEIVLSNDTQDSQGEARPGAARDQPDAQPGQPRRPDQPAPGPGGRHRAQRRRGEALLGWLTDDCRTRPTSTGTEDDAAAAAPPLAPAARRACPRRLKRAPRERCWRWSRRSSARARGGAARRPVDEHERPSSRSRCAGCCAACTARRAHKRAVAARGVVDGRPHDARATCVRRRAVPRR